MERGHESNRVQRKKVKDVPKIPYDRSFSVSDYLRCYAISFEEGSACLTNPSKLTKKHFTVWFLVINYSESEKFLYHF